MMTLSVLVFPTHVGVFLSSIPQTSPQCGLPHARGGVSPLSYEAGEAAPSSPRTWGCFYLPMPAGGVRPVFPTHVGVFLHAALGLRAYRVFPTHVGVFRKKIAGDETTAGLPHARGGVSGLGWASVVLRRSSPRTWGCFLAERLPVVLVPVFPTHVGVFLILMLPILVMCSLPHARGGVSKLLIFTHDGIMSSPRTWGCFCRQRLGSARKKVFPTHVGVFLHAGIVARLAVRLPHARGGVSHHRPLLLTEGGSSPRTWGCFSPSRPGRKAPAVFPTHVGVFPQKLGIASVIGGLPHARGGVSRCASHRRT